MAPGAALSFRLLGPIEVEGPEGTIALAGGKQRALLALLLLDLDEVVSVDRLLAGLWGDDVPETATTALQGHVSRLRRLLEPGRPPGGEGELLVTRPPGYALRLPPDALDVRRFERLVAEGRAALPVDPAAAAERLHAALALWRGPALADLAYEPFAQGAIGRLEEARLTATEDRIEADLALGRHAALVGELEALVAAHPLRERLRGQLMLSLYRSGRQAEALAAYQEARSTLVEELGIEPGPALQRLERSVLQQDPALDPAVAPPPAPPGGPGGCPACAGPLPAAARFCPACGAALLQAAPAGPARRLVTVLAAAPAGAAPLDPEAAAAASERLRAHAVAAVEPHGGSALAGPDGAVLAVFGARATREDDPLRALRAAAELCEALGAAVRLGVESGEALVDAVGEPRGEPVAAAVALREAAAPGEALVGPVARSLAGPAAELAEAGSARLAGRHAPLPAGRLVAVDPEAQAVERRPGAALVGRDEELAALRAALARATRTGSLHLFTVLGPAGIGKSRLVAELLAGLDGARGLVGRALPYGDGVTYRPLAAVVRGAAGGDDAAAIAALVGGPDGALVAERLLAAIGGGGQLGSADELAWALRRLVEALARSGPLVLALDDLHWAEPPLLDLVDALAERAADLPVLLVCVAREELLELRPGWGGGRPNATAILLDPLPREAAGRLVDALPVAARLDVGTRGAVVEVGEGNPLFLEQLAAMLAEGGAPGSLPLTIQALLAARLDRLGPGERLVLERAAVVGRAVPLAALAELVPPELASTLAGHADGLVRRQLLEHDRGASEGAYRFRHALVQEAAYRAAPKATRAELHERLAAWLGADEGDAVAAHLERAFLARRDVAPDDPRLAGLAARARAALGAAGGGALARGDVGAAAGLLGRADALPGGDDPALLVLLGDALHAVGRTDDARGALDRAVAAARAAGDATAEAHAAVERLFLAALVDDAVPVAELRERGEAAAALFAAHGDERGQAKAWRLVGEAELTACRWGASAAALERAVAHARAAGDARELRASVPLLANALYYGPTPVAEALARLDALAEAAARQPLVEANLRCYRAGLHALRGEADEARTLYLAGRELFAELGHAYALGSHRSVTGPVELLLGDAAVAERDLAEGIALLDAMGERAVCSTLHAFRAEALLALGRDAEAERATEAAEAAAAPDDVATQVAWRAARAVARARGGDAAAAVELARDAVALADQTDFPTMRATARGALAAALAAVGDPAGAAEARADAVALLDAKGAPAAAALLPR